MTSLNGEVEQGVIVEAVGDRPECNQEESKTEADGSYRIRGLQVHLIIHLTDKGKT